MILPSILGLNITCKEREWYIGSEDSCFIRDEQLEENEPVFSTESAEKLNATTEVTIEGGNITFVPKELFKIFMNLQKVVFEKCELHKIIEGSFTNAANLKIFSCTDNEIEELPARMFLGAESLDNIMIEKSMVTKIDGAAFVGLSQTAYLDLEQNQISDLPVNVFAPLPSLTHLVLVKNKIEVLPSGLFKNNQKLKHVDLSENQINIVDPNLFCVNKNIIVIGFEKNLCADSEYVVGNNIFHVELKKCYENYFESAEFLKNNISKFHHYKCFLETMDDHQMLIYQHLFENFQNVKQITNADWKLENDNISKLETKQNWIIAALFMVVITMSAYILFIQYKISVIIGDRRSVKMSDLRELIQ